MNNLPFRPAIYLFAIVVAMVFAHWFYRVTAPPDRFSFVKTGQDPITQQDTYMGFDHKTGQTCWPYPLNAEGKTTCADLYAKW